MKKIIYFVFSLAMTLGGLFLIFSSKISDNIAFSIGQPLFYGFLPITIYFLILSFFSFTYIKYQYKFFNYFFILSIILLFFVPTDCRAPLSLCADKQKMSLFLSLFFIFLSVIYNIVIYFKNKKKST